MAKKTKAPSPRASIQPLVFEAMLGPDGTVIKGHPLTQTQAERRRKLGLDVVVCGSDLSANRRLAGLIERNANGKAKRCPPHPSAGPRALPHYQPEPRTVLGHTFYETPNRQAL